MLNGSEMKCYDVSHILIPHSPVQ